MMRDADADVITSIHYYYSKFGVLLIVQLKLLVVLVLFDASTSFI